MDSMLQMQDLPQAILAALAKASGPISSLDLAAKLSCDVQKVVGAVKSLEVLEGYIETEMVAAKRPTSILFCTGLCVSTKRTLSYQRPVSMFQNHV